MMGTRYQRAALITHFTSYDGLFKKNVFRINKVVNLYNNHSFVTWSEAVAIFFTHDAILGIRVFIT